jgi:hypothetical protein
VLALALALRNGKKARAFRASKNRSVRLSTPT